MLGKKHEISIVLSSMQPTHISLVVITLSSTWHAITIVEVTVFMFITGLMIIKIRLLVVEQILKMSTLTVGGSLLKMTKIT